MHQTLLYIPTEIFGIPVFGVGILLFIWVVIALISLISDAHKNGSWKSAASFIPLAAIVAAVIIWVLPQLVKPTGLAIQSYGAMMLLGILSGVFLAIIRAKKWGIKSDTIIALAIWLCVPGIIGARLFFCIEYWSSLQADTVLQTVRNMLNFTEGGLVVYGSVFGAVIGLIFFFLFTTVKLETPGAVLQRLPVLTMLDIIAPSMVLGLAFGRIGCLLNGCCFGGVCNVDQVPWAITFPAGSPPFISQVEQGLIHLEDQPLQGIVLEEVLAPTGSPTKTILTVKSVQKDSAAEKAGVQANDMILAINNKIVFNEKGEVLLPLAYYQLTADARHVGSVHLKRFKAPDVSWTYSPQGEIRSLPVHPTQIYSSINAIILFIIVMFFDRFRHWPGATFALLFTLYPITRWVLEYIRVDESGFMNTGMSISQNISLILLPIMLLFWIYIGYRARKTEVSK